MLMRLKRLCRRPEMWVLPPPGGPMAAKRNISWKTRKYISVPPTLPYIYILHLRLPPYTHSHQPSLSHLDTLGRLLLPVVPEAVVDPEAEQLQRWLGPEFVLGRHVEVVQKGQHALPSQGHKDPLSALFNPPLDNGLHIAGCSLVAQRPEIKTRAPSSNCP